MTESLSLRAASVQDIQLELIRRTKFNSFDGEQIYAALLHHRDLWLAVLLDRPGIPNYAEPTHLLMSGLIKLRDLDGNLWNADTLFVLTENLDKARQFAHLAATEEWGAGGMVHVPDDRTEIDHALGVGRMDLALVTIWWD